MNKLSKKDSVNILYYIFFAAGFWVCALGDFMNINNRPHALLLSIGGSYVFCYFCWRQIKKHTNLSLSALNHIKRFFLAFPFTYFMCKCPMYWLFFDANDKAPLIPSLIAITLNIALFIGSYILEKYFPEKHKDCVEFINPLIQHIISMACCGGSEDPLSRTRSDTPTIDFPASPNLSPLDHDPAYRNCLSNDFYSPPSSSSIHDHNQK